MRMKIENCAECPCSYYDYEDLRCNLARLNCQGDSPNCSDERIPAGCPLLEGQVALATETSAALPLPERCHPRCIEDKLDCYTMVLHYLTMAVRTLQGSVIDTHSYPTNAEAAALKHKQWLEDIEQIKRELIQVADYLKDGR